MQLVPLLSKENNCMLLQEVRSEFLGLVEEHDENQFHYVCFAVFSKDEARIFNV